MTKQLRDDDAQAVDLLLDGFKNSSTGGFATPMGDSVVRRIGAVEIVLRLLSEMPAGEPPPNLVEKTLEHVQHRGNQLSSIEGRQSSISEQDQA